MKRILTIAAISTILILSIAACGNVPTGSGNVPQPRSLSASGIGEVYLVPDVAYIYVGVRVEADDVSTALADNNTQANEVASALEALGVESKDIQTSSFNVYPMQDYSPEGQISRRFFVVENTVYITVRDLSKLGQMLDSVVRSGANSINGVTFDVQDKETALAQARDLAIQKARAEAESIAAASGVKLGDLQSVNVYSSGGPTPLYEGKGGAMASASNVPVSAGQLVLTVTANLNYEIK